MVHQHPSPMLVAIMVCVCVCVVCVCGGGGQGGGGNFVIELHILALHRALQSLYVPEPCHPWKTLMSPMLPALNSQPARQFKTVLMLTVQHDDVQMT